MIAGEVGRSHTHSGSDKSRFYLGESPGFLRITEVGFPETPMLFNEESLYDFNSSACCAMSATRIIWSIFF